MRIPIPLSWKSPPMSARHRPDRRAHQRGLSIVELMIGIVISLLVGLAASNSAIVFGAMQRQGLSAGGSVVSSATTLAQIKEDAGQAGLGFFGNGIFMCNGLNLRVGATVLDRASFSPAAVTRAGGNDQIDLVYATAVAGGANVALQSASALATADLQSYLPANVNDAVLVAPKDVGPRCTVRSVSAVTASTATTPQSLAFAATGSHNQGPAITSPSLYAIGSRVSLLGALQWHRYRVVNGNLQLELPMQTGANATAVLVRNVVALRVRIGIVGPNAGDSAIASWVAPDAAAPNGGTWGQPGTVDLGRVRALRVNLVTRSTQPELPKNGGSCEATDDSPLVLFDDPLDRITPPAVGSNSWRCYRYRTNDLVIPLRNYIVGLRA